MAAASSSLDPFRRNRLIWRGIRESVLMAKGYWIAHVTVTDPEQYQQYASSTKPAFDRFGGVILARAGRYEQMEGQGRPRNVIIEFPSLQAALDCYNSPEYQSAKAKRAGAGIAEIVLVEGV
jgi:uncharacterized protein (DUF1330 family)